MIKYLSLFSGIGGFELGIQQAYDIKTQQRCKARKNGMDITSGNLPNNRNIDEPPVCIGYSEIDKYAIQIYEKHFNHKNYGNITKINAKELPNFELLVGGFPCQSFSIAGKRLGFSDKRRGNMFFEVARIIKQKQPRLLLLENVKGLLSHDQGSTFYTIIATLDELGYDCQWQVLNSKNFGVPQNRERVFIIGHLRGTRRPEVFPIGQNDKIFNGKNKSKKRRPQAKYSTTLRGSNIKADNTFIKQLNKPKHSNNRVYSDKGLSPTLNTAQGGNRQPKIVKVSGDLDKRKTYLGEIANTLAANPTSDNTARLFKDNKIRRLTPTECERLQGFPDGWTKTGWRILPKNKWKYKQIPQIEVIEISDTQRYKTLGNAVTVNVIKAIMLKLL